MRGGDARLPGGRWRALRPLNCTLRPAHPPRLPAPGHCRPAEGWVDDDQGRACDAPDGSGEPQAPGEGGGAVHCATYAQGAKPAVVGQGPAADCLVLRVCGVRQLCGVEGEAQ